jgi:hypothetical protein
VFSMQSVQKLYMENSGRQLDGWSNRLGERQLPAGKDVNREDLVCAVAICKVCKLVTAL